MKIVTSDKVHMELPDSIVHRSELLKNMESDLGSIEDELELPNVSSDVLKHIVRWHARQRDVPFFHRLKFREELLPLMMAADFLMMDDLFSGALKYIRDQIKMLAPQDLREYLELENTWSPEEQDTLNFLNYRVALSDHGS